MCQVAAVCQDTLINEYQYEYAFCAYWCALPFRLFILWLLDHYLHLCTWTGCHSCLSVNVVTSTACWPSYEQRSLPRDKRPRRFVHQSINQAIYLPTTEYRQDTRASSPLTSISSTSVHRLSENHQCCIVYCHCEYVCVCVCVCVCCSE